MSGPGRPDGSGEINGFGRMDGPGEEPLDAAAQWEALQGAESRMAGVREASQRSLAWFCTVLGLLIGAAHVIPSAVRPEEHLAGFLTAIGVYVVAVLAVTAWYLRTRSATPLGGGRRYLVGFMGSMVLYVASMLLMALPEREPVPVAILVGLVIAAPLVVAGWWRRS